MPPAEGRVADGGGGLILDLEWQRRQGLFLLAWQDLRPEFRGTLDGTTRPVEMDAGAAAPLFFGNHCDREGGMAPSLGDSARLSPSSPHGAGGDGGAR